MNTIQKCFFKSFYKVNIFEIQYKVRSKNVLQYDYSYLSNIYKYLSCNFCLIRLLSRFYSAIENKRN